MSGAAPCYTGEGLAFATSPAWIEGSPFVLAYEAGLEPHSGVGLLTADPGEPPVIHTPEGEADWTDPVPVAVHGEETAGLLVVEACCGDGTGMASTYETSVGRVLDPATGEVLSSIPFDGVVIDLDVSVDRWPPGDLPGRSGRRGRPVHRRGPRARDRLRRRQLVSRQPFRAAWRGFRASKAAWNCSCMRPWASWASGRGSWTAVTWGAASGSPPWA